MCVCICVHSIVYYFKSSFKFFLYFKFLPWADLSVLFSTGLPVSPALQHIYKFDSIFFPMGNDEMEMLE